MPIDLTTPIVRTQDLMTAPADRDMVILNLAKGNYVALDEIGRRIWELLSVPRYAADLCRQLSAEFDATPEQIAADVLPFLNELQAENLVQIVNG